MSTKPNRYYASDGRLHFENCPSGTNLSYSRLVTNERVMQWRKLNKAEDGIQKRSTFSGRPNLISGIREDLLRNEVPSVNRVASSDRPLDGISRNVVKVHYKYSDTFSTAPSLSVVFEEEASDRGSGMALAEPKLTTETDETARLRLVGEVENSAYSQDTSGHCFEEVTNVDKDGSGLSTEPHHPQLAYSRDPSRFREMSRSRSRSRYLKSIRSCSLNVPSSQTPSDDILDWALATFDPVSGVEEMASYFFPPAIKSFEGLRCANYPEFFDTPPDDECLELFYGLRKQLLVPELPGKDFSEIIRIMNIAAKWKSLPTPVKNLVYKHAVLVFNNTLRDYGGTDGDLSSYSALWVSYNSYVPWYLA